MNSFIFASVLLASFAISPSANDLARAKNLKMNAKATTTEKWAARLCDNWQATAAELRSVRDLLDQARAENVRLKAELDRLKEITATQPSAGAKKRKPVNLDEEDDLNSPYNMRFRQNADGTSDVEGYLRKDGTYVPPHRTGRAPDRRK